MPVLNLLDVAKLKGNRKEIGLIESVMTAAPELSAIAARTIRGTSYQTVDRTALPNTGFANANEGIVPSKSDFATKTVECFIFRGAVNVDKAVASAHEDGAAALTAIEADGVGRSAGIEIGKQVWYGTAEDSKGFPGLRSLCPAGMKLDATGTTAGTGSSVYGVKFGPQFVQMVYGGGSVLSLPPFREQSVTDAAGGQYDAYVSNLTAWIGMQCVHPYAIGRIYNLTAENGKGLTDSLLAGLLELYPVGFEPDAWFMTRRSRTQLQRSRTVVLQGNGARGSVGSAEGLVAPLPTEAFGIPIIVTDNLLNTEVLGAA
jgi:hypothetical protein